MHELRDAAARPPARALLAIATLFIAIAQLRTIDLRAAVDVVPSALPFWTLFLLSCLTMPLSEWLIYRLLWRLPISGLLPILRKSASNASLVGYSGDIYFYSWARRHAGLAHAPFGAIKDVAILSAVAGNVVALALVALAWPALDRSALADHRHEIAAIALVLSAASVPAMIFRNRLLSLPTPQLRQVFVVHVARIVVDVTLTGLLWHAALPATPLGWILVLSALRQLASRLPMIAGRDITFAAMTAYLIGPETGLVAVIALCGTLTLGIQLATVGLLSAADMATAGARRPSPLHPPQIGDMR